MFRDDSFLGRGWSFPPRFSAGGRGLETVDGVEDIKQALQILLGTRPGERVLHESYGCDLADSLFEELDQRSLNALESRIRDAVLDHEPRIHLHRVDVTPSPSEPGLLSISLQYSPVGTNSRFNMVFPFYLREATWTTS